eukprot:6173632-Pleurochrysis_carterae.AAC.6
MAHCCAQGIAYSRPTRVASSKASSASPLRRRKVDVAPVTPFNMLVRCFRCEPKKRLESAASKEVMTDLPIRGRAEAS